MRTKKNLVRDIDVIIKNIERGFIDIKDVENTLIVIANEVAHEKTDFARDINILIDDIKQGDVNIDQAKDILKSIAYEQYKTFFYMSKAESLKDDSGIGKKEFSGTVSVAAKISFKIKAETEEEAKKKLFSSSFPISLVDEDGRSIKITSQSWDFALESEIKCPHIVDFEIRESK